MGPVTIDWVKTFTAAATGGVKNYFVEQTGNSPSKVWRAFWGASAASIAAILVLLMSPRSSPGPGQSDAFLRYFRGLQRWCSREWPGSRGSRRSRR